MIKLAAPPESMNRENSRPSGAFTLMELLVVISIIAILMGLAFPAFQGVQNAAKKTQAKNDLVQIVTAANAFYTEYGTYPSLYSPEMTFDGKNNNNNDKLFNELRGTDFAKMNPRDITFINPPVAKDTGNPRSGLDLNGVWFDPWGSQYLIRLDTDYDGKVSNAYAKNAGFGTVDQGVIAWSIGKDKKTDPSDKNAADSKDDVLSWQ